MPKNTGHRFIAALSAEPGVPELRRKNEQSTCRWQSITTDHQVSAMKTIFLRALLTVFRCGLSRPGKKGSHPVRLPLHSFPADGNIHFMRIV